MLDAHQWVLPHLSALVPARGENDDWQTGIAQGVGLATPGSFVAIDLIANPFLGTRLVLTLKWHLSIVDTPTASPDVQAWLGDFVAEHFYRPAEGHRLPHDPFNAIVAPRPIGWISSLSADGIRNLAPYSFFNAFNYKPPIVGFASTSFKHSVANIEATREFTWNLVTRAQAEAMNATSATVSPEVDEFDLAGLVGAASSEVAPERVAGAPVSFECRLTQLIRLTDHRGRPADTWLTLGEVVGVHIDEDLLDGGVYNTARARPVLRGGGPTAYFEITPEARFDLVRPP
jgi:flavin reductase (DIM6/NTAB) family NADH-FMN oxidoreductase RutF